MRKSRNGILSKIRSAIREFFLNNNISGTVPSIGEKFGFIRGKNDVVKVNIATIERTDNYSTKVTGSIGSGSHLFSGELGSETSRKRDYNYDDNAVRLINTKKRDLVSLINKKLEGECTVSSLSFDSDNATGLTILINLSFQDQKKMNESVLLEAEFTFLPKLRRDPAMKEYVNSLKEAEQLLKSNNIESGPRGSKIFRVLFRILDIYTDVCGIATTVSCITIIGIIPHLIGRAWEWAYANAEEAFAHDQGIKLMTALDNAIAKESNSDLKNKLIKVKDNLERTIGPANKSVF